MRSGSDVRDRGRINEQKVSVVSHYTQKLTLFFFRYLRFNDNNLEAITELIEEEIQKTQSQIDEQRNSQIAQMSHTPRPSKAARVLHFH